ncbi:hypothetical protein AB0J86_31270 [Micromonospora sp. NPDC049559]|uniref:hypothetical protein n=1 Tax=Micromonospora sp. NPDC049559 TaxID=3155923 RepID=UPI003413FC2D
MGDGIVVPTDKLTSTAEVMKALSTSADQIATGLKDADPPGILWGGLGLIMKWKYDQKAEEARDHIRKIAEALDSQSGAIKETAQRYCQLDEALDQAFKRFQEKLSGGK